jgi:S1-C subfamily serine protease
MVRRTRQQGVPVIQVDDQYIIGFDQPRLEQALANGARSRPTFGASVADVSGVNVRRDGLPDGGAYVGRVREGSAAQRAGLAAGDVIVEVNGRPVLTAAQLQSSIAGLQSGARLRVTYVRQGERRTGEAQL